MAVSLVVGVEVGAIQATGSGEAELLRMLDMMMTVRGEEDSTPSSL